MTPLLLAASFGISVIFKLPIECLPYNESDGSTTYYEGCYVTTRPNAVYVSPKLKGRYRTKVILHEIGHAQGYQEESKADS